MNLRKLVRIARWEVTKNAGGVDRRTVIIAIAAIVALGGIGPVILATGGVAVDQGLYRVGVQSESPYYSVIATEPAFAVRQDVGQSGLGSDVELVIRDESIVVANTPKGQAAAQELRDTVVRSNDRRLVDEPNQTAAFPVFVQIEYREQAGQVISSAAGDQTATDESDPARGDTGGDQRASARDQGDDGGDGRGVADVGGFGSGLSGDESTTGSPSEIAPPFPFESLILAFVFVVPLNFLIQAYGSTILSERLNRRGELMLVAPVTRTDIIAGKTLPYFLGAILIEGIIAVGVTVYQTGSLGGLISIAALFPLIVLFLGATFLGAMFARSFKELTFVTVTITVALTSYAFVPAIFTETGPVALISPLTIVVRDLQGQVVSLAGLVFSVTPPLLTGMVMFGLGAGLYREEDMFTQRPIPLKVLDALAGRIRHRWHVAVLTALLMPFVFVAELLAVALLFALGQISIPMVLAFVAVIEEIGKSLHIYAGYTHDRFDTGLKTALGLGLLSGVGFFVAEKLSVLAQLVGLQEMALGNAALSTGLANGPVLIGFLVAPLLLHTVTAAMSAVGARNGRRPYLIGLAGAILVHFAYNLVVVIGVA